MENLRPGPNAVTTASSLATSGAAVNVSGASPPTTGQVLKATSATTATWQAEAGGGTGLTWNVETLSANKTLSDTDEVGQALDPNGAHRTVTLHATPADGDRYLIKNTDPDAGSTKHLKIVDNSGAYLHLLLPGEMVDLSYNGSAWIGGFDIKAIKKWWWLDAAYGTYTNSGMTTPATNDGDEVEGWKSREGAGITAFTGGTGPTLKLNQVNSLPTVRFNGSSTVLNSQNARIPDDINIFFVAKRDWASSQASYRGVLNRGTSFVIYFTGPASGDWVTGGVLFYGNGSGSGTPPRAVGSYGAITDGTFHVWGASLGTHDSDATLDGNSIATSARADDRVDQAVGAMQLGQDGAGNYFDGDIAEMIAIAGPMSLAERRRIIFYLGQKYGLTVS